MRQVRVETRGHRSPGSRKAACGSRGGEKRSRDPGNVYKLVGDNRERIGT